MFGGRLGGMFDGGFDGMFGGRFHGRFDGVFDFRHVPCAPLIVRAREVMPQRYRWTNSRALMRTDMCMDTGTRSGHSPVERHVRRHAHGPYA